MNVLLLMMAMSSQEYVPGQTYRSPDKYVEMLAGNLPIVITVPHGGSSQPASMPARTKAACNDPSFSTGNDSNTYNLGANIAGRIYDATGKWPWVIYNKLHRSRLDSNRDLQQAACGDPEAEAAWYQFHDYIAIARQHVTGPGWQMDIHGHGNPANLRLELGWLISGYDLYNPGPFKSASSLYAFAEASPKPFDELLRELGTELTNKGYRSLPALQDWATEGEAYYSGGYLTSRYTCLELSDQICGVQLELPGYIRGTADSRTAYSRVLANVLVPYLQQFNVDVQFKPGYLP